MLQKILFRLTGIALSFVIVSMALGLMIFGLSIGTNAQAPDKAPDAAQASVGTAFIYQGQLIQNGSPVSDTCDFQFPMYDAVSGGNYLGDASGTAAVKNGYFNITLDFGVNAFQGDARWLEVFVRCPSATGSYTHLDGRIALNPAPYALSLRPGAVISGSVLGGASFSANNAYDGMLASYGVQGASQDVGVMGAGGNTGVQGESSAANGKGVYGYASGSSGVNYGVYGKSDSPNGYGVYSEGNAHVTGNLEAGSLKWGAKTSFISIPAAAFTAQDRVTGHSNYGYMLTTGSPPDDIFYAPVQLPHQAVVTAMAFSWDDASTTANITCTLYVDAMGAVGPANYAIAQAISAGNSGAGRSVTNNIDPAYVTVDNSQYIYYLAWDLEDASTRGLGVIIEYTINEPY